MDGPARVAITLAGRPEEVNEVVGTGKATYVARVNGPGDPPDHTPSMVSFTQWWEGTAIKDLSGTIFTRANLVLTMANQEGGAHVDRQLNASYASLTKFNSQGWQVMSGDGVTPPDNSIAAASVRQIAHEVLVSLTEAFPSELPSPSPASS